MRVEFGDYRLDTEQRSLMLRGERVPVEPRVFDLLAYLIDRRERAVSTDELLDAVWPGVSVNPTSLSQAIHKARQAVGDDGERETVLRTEHGHGFRFVAEVSLLPSVEGTAQAPTGFRVRRVTTAGVVALLLAVGTAWLLNRPVDELASIRSIAVLPLSNLSGNPEQEYFSDGMTEALISNLAKVSALRVISRTSAMHYKDTQKTLPEIAQELNVDALVEGSVIRSGDRVRITVQLIDGSSDRHLWSEEYERELRDVLVIQSEIARAIANEIRVALTPADEKRFASARAVDPAAYGWVLKGNHYVDTQEFERATDAYERAIEIEPNYARAYAGLSSSYSLRAHWRSDPPAMVLPQAKAAALKALEIDPRHSTAYNALGEIALVEGDLPEAGRQYERGVELDPGDAWSHHNYADVLSMLGRYEEAIAEIERASQLNPVSDLTNSVAVLIRMRESRYEEAIERGREALTLNPYSRLVHLRLAQAYLKAQRPQEAIAEAELCVEQTGGFSPCVRFLAKALEANRGIDGAISRQHSEVESISAGQNMP
jgi:TolB-like protein/DNA-binding winged helix-turn-helix (wHTH) protein